MRKKDYAFILTIICLVMTALTVYWIGGIDSAQLQTLLKQAGLWAPLIYIVCYVVATLLMLPSTALNLTGGAMFGPWLGTLWTSVAAIAAAAVSFAYTRTVGRRTVVKALPKSWQAIDAGVQREGMLYIFAIRLLPIIPYGLVNFTAGLTSISFKDYILGTILGTIPGVFPFVLIGSSSLKLWKTGNFMPLVAAMGLVGILVMGATWYRSHSSKKVKE